MRSAVILFVFLLLGTRTTSLQSEPNVKRTSSMPSLRKLVQGAMVGAATLHHSHAQPQGPGEKLVMNQPNVPSSSTNPLIDIRGGGQAEEVTSPKEVSKKDVAPGVLGGGFVRNPFLGSKQTEWEGTNRAGIVSMRLEIIPEATTVKVQLKAPFQAWSVVPPKTYIPVSDTKFSVTGLTSDEKASMRGTESIEVDFEEGPDNTKDKLVVTCKKKSDQDPYTFTLKKKKGY